MCKSKSDYVSSLDTRWVKVIGVVNSPTITLTEQVKIGTSTTISDTVSVSIKESTDYKVTNTELSAEYSHLY